MTIKLSLAKQCEVAMSNARKLLAASPLPHSQELAATVEALAEHSAELWTQIDEQAADEPPARASLTTVFCCAMAAAERRNRQWQAQNQHTYGS
jgi:Tfp pilus assembly protein PilN